MSIFFGFAEFIWPPYVLSSLEPSMLSHEGIGRIVGNPVLVDKGSVGVGSTQTFGSDPCIVEFPNSLCAYQPGVARGIRR